MGKLDVPEGPDKPEKVPELQIITPGTQPEATHLPPEVAENIIGKIEQQEVEERRRQREIERNKKPRLN